MAALAACRRVLLALSPSPAPADVARARTLRCWRRSRLPSPGAIGVFHAGVESKIFEGFTHLHGDDARRQHGRSGRDHERAAGSLRPGAMPFLGISMAGWNAILSLGGAALILFSALKAARREPLAARRRASRTAASMLRVDQAGEYGATRIYAGQLAVLRRNSPAASDRPHGRAGRAPPRALRCADGRARVRPTALQPFWNVAGFCAWRRDCADAAKAAMACTAAVETEIDRITASSSPSSARTIPSWPPISRIPRRRVGASRRGARCRGCTGRCVPVTDSGNSRRLPSWPSACRSGFEEPAVGLARFKRLKGRKTDEARSPPSPQSAALIGGLAAAAPVSAQTTQRTMTGSTKSSCSAPTPVRARPTTRSSSASALAGGERFRIPERLRARRLAPAASGLGQQGPQHRAALAATGIQSCSPVGPAGYTGCMEQMINQAKEENCEAQYASTAPQ